MTSDELTDDALADACANRAVALDTVTISVTGDRPIEGWYFLPSVAYPRHGIAFRLMYSNETVVSEPLYFVDLDARTKTLISTDIEGDAGWVRSLLSERCGVLLVFCGAHGYPLIDATSGKVIFSQPWNSTGGEWVLPPSR